MKTFDAGFSIFTLILDALLSSVKIPMKAIPSILLILFVGNAAYAENVKDTYDQETLKGEQANFSGKSVYMTSFQSTKITGGNFVKALAVKSNFYFSSLNGVDFSGATLLNAVFQGATFAGDCSFAGADLRGANFLGVIIEDMAKIRFDGATFDAKTVLPFSVGEAKKRGMVDADCNGPSGAKLALAIAAVEKEITARNIVPKYEYVPAQWGTETLTRPSETLTVSTPSNCSTDTTWGLFGKVENCLSGITTAVSTGPQGRSTSVSTSSGYSSYSSPLWGLFGKKTSYAPGTTRTVTAGPTIETVRVLVRAGSFKRAQSYLTSLPFTTSDLTLLDRHINENDYPWASGWTLSLLLSRETTQMLKRMTTTLIESPSANLTDIEIRLLRAIESAYLSGEVDKSWQYHASNHWVDSLAPIGQDFSHGLKSRTMFFKLLLDHFPAMLGLGSAKMLGYDPDSKVDFGKLATTMAGLSAADRDAQYWKRVDFMIQKVNYSEYVQSWIPVLTREVEMRRINSLGTLLKSVDPRSEECTYDRPRP